MTFPQVLSDDVATHGARASLGARRVVYVIVADVDVRHNNGTMHAGAWHRR